jgi:hypothetical protein
MREVQALLMEYLDLCAGWLSAEAKDRLEPLLK